MHALAWATVEATNFQDMFWGLLVFLIFFFPSDYLGLL